MPWGVALPPVGLDVPDVGPPSVAVPPVQAASVAMSTTVAARRFDMGAESTGTSSEQRIGLLGPPRPRLQMQRREWVLGEVERVPDFARERFADGGPAVGPSVGRRVESLALEEPILDQLQIGIER